MRTSVTSASAAVGVACGLNITNVTAMADQMAGVYSTSLTGVGLLTTVLVLSHTLSQVPGGRIADRYGALSMARVALVVILLGNICLLIVPSFELAFPLRAAVGLGTGAGFVAGSQLIRSGGGHAFAQGVFGGIGIGATGVALAVVPQLQPLVGWRAPYFTVVVTTAAALVVSYCVGRTPDVDGHVLSGRGSASLVKDRRLQRLGILHGVSLLSVVVGAWTSVFFVRTLGVTSRSAGFIGSLALLGGILTRPGAGWLFYRRPDLVRVMLATSLLSGALGTALIATAHSVFIAVLGTVVLGLAAGVPFGPAFFGAGHARPDAPGASVGLVNAAGNTAVMIGTPLLGLTFSLTRDGRVGFMVVALLWLLALLALPKTEDFGTTP